MKNGIAKINNNSNSYQIIIPAKTSNLMLLLGPLSLGAIYFFFFGFNDGHNLKDILNFTDLDLFSVIWILGFIYFFTHYLIILLWSYFGKEKLIIERGYVHLEKSIFGIGKKIKIKSSLVENFRFNKIDNSQTAIDLKRIFNLKIGKINFDYGLKTYGFGNQIDDPEAIYLIQEIEKRFQYYNG